LISPLLFAVLCQSLKPSQSNFSYVKYADDLTVIHHTRTPSDNTDLQNEINHISQWCSNNFMIINEKKTKIIHVNIRKQPCPPVVKINNTFVNLVESSRLLGVHFSSSLKWKDHVDSSVSKAAKLIFPLLQLKRCNLSPNILLKLYQQVIRPHLSYACAVTMNMSQLNKKKLRKMERRCLLMIDIKPDETVLKFCERLNSNLSKKVLSYCHHPVRQLLQPVLHNKTRSQQQLRPPHAKSTLMKNSFIKLFA